MPRIVSKIEDPPIKDEIITGFLGGLNSFQDETVLKDSELTKAKNILLSVDGIEPRPGTLQFGGDNGDSNVLGGFAYYKSDGTRELLRMSGGKLYKKNGSAWTQIGTKTWNTTARANFLQARDLVFIFNGVDYLCYYNGTTIVEYSSLTTPVGLAVTTGGTAGTTQYSYRVSAFNTTGETLACTNVVINTGNAILDATNYCILNWTAVAGATGYVIYGRKSTGLGEMYMATVYTNTYNDKGQDTPSTATLPPEANTTQGIICAKAIFAQSRVFAAGDLLNPSRLYYGGIGSKIAVFAFSETGGGATDIFKNDGAILRDILAFQGGIICWKDNAIYRFSIATGVPTLEEITRSFGGIAWRAAQHVENDVVFPAKKDGRLAFYSLGNQENYSANILRTNELSIKIASQLSNVNLNNLPYACAFYFNNIYGCAIAQEGSTVNDRIWILDTRFGAWVHWDDLKPNFFTTFIDTDGSMKLLYGDEVSGYFQEMFRAERNDNGSAISVEWATKSFNQKQFRKFKDYYDPSFQFKDVTVSGALQGDIIIDGAIVNANFTINPQSTGGAGVGVMLVGFHVPGEAPGGTVASEFSSDVPVQVETLQTARSIKYAFRSSTINARYKFLSAAHQYQILDLDLPPGYRTYA